jgi:hypothetical protein
LTPAVADDRPAVDSEFVPFSVSAEVVVVIEDKDFRFSPRRFPEKVRRRKSADAAAHND